MGNDTHEKGEIETIFIPEAHQKLNELQNMFEILYEKGPTPSAIEVIYRASFSLKSICTVYEQHSIVDIISKEIDPIINRIRVRGTVASSHEQNSLTEKMQLVRNKIELLLPSNKEFEAPYINTPEEEPPIKDLSVMLSAVGQLSIWSFHDINNYLSKIQGYSDMFEDCITSLVELSSPRDLQDVITDLKAIQEKISENAHYIQTTVSRIRGARGRFRFEPQEISLKSLIGDMLINPLFSRINVTWNANVLPDVQVLQDTNAFSAVWLFLWKLLIVWQDSHIPHAPLKALCDTRIEVGKNLLNSKDYADIFYIYIWIEPTNVKDIKFFPEKIQFGNTTHKPDIGNVFHVISTIAQTNNIRTEVGETPTGLPIFSISLPCGLATLSEKLAQEIPAEDEVTITKDTSLDKNLSSRKNYVLVVDDEKDLRSILSAKINKLGFPVIAVETIAEARIVLKNEKVKVILADLFLSQESGLDLLREVKTNYPNIKCLFMSGANEDDVPLKILQVLKTYADDFLKKPIATSMLHDALTKFYS